MNVHEFVEANQGKWKELESFVEQMGRTSLARVQLDQFQAGSLAYRQTVSDLAYARMRFKEDPVVNQLESLLRQAHSVIYQSRRRSKGSWRQFWLHTWPALVRRHMGVILSVTVFFWIAAAVGLVLAILFPQVENFFVSPAMREAIDQKHLWTEGITSAAPQASSAIATNNISVCLLAWGLGVTFGIGTVWLLLFNGLMLGIVFAACLRAGLGADLAEFVVAHGSLELPAIWISAAAGLLVGKALVLPGQYRRGVEMRLATGESIQLLAGAIPMLLVAAVVEGFISPSQLSGMTKAVVGLVLASIYLAYIAGGAVRAASAQLAPEIS